MQGWTRNGTSLHICCPLDPRCRCRPHELMPPEPDHGASHAWSHSCTPTAESGGEGCVETSPSWSIKRLPRRSAKSTLGYKARPPIEKVHAVFQTSSASGFSGRSCAYREVGGPRASLAFRRSCSERVSSTMSGCAGGRERSLGRGRRTVGLPSKQHHILRLRCRESAPRDSSCRPVPHGLRWRTEPELLAALPPDGPASGSRC